YKPYLK
ncbi:hypothetical protein D041_3183B, partial [Vibrio parahaemolyticus EKP-008]